MSPRLPRVTSTDVLRALYRAGWKFARQSGSHIQLIHQQKHGRVTISHHPGLTIKPKTLKRILEQAGMTEDELRSLL